MIKWRTRGRRGDFTSLPFPSDNFIGKNIYNGGALFKSS
jgi:hypothetical protein